MPSYGQTQEMFRVRQLTKACIFRHPSGQRCSNAAH